MPEQPCKSITASISVNRIREAVNTVDYFVSSVYLIVMVASLTPRAQHRVEQYNRILEMAANVVAKGGIDALGINKLAKSLGLTPGALYRYFDSKEALLGALTERFLGQIKLNLEEAVRGIEQPTLRLLRLIDAYRAQANTRPNRFGFLSMLMADQRVLVGRKEDAIDIMKAMQSTLGPVEVAMKEAMDASDMTQGCPKQRTLALFVAIHGALQLKKQARIAPDLISPDTIIRELTDSLLKGWGVDPIRLEEAYQEKEKYK